MLSGILITIILIILSVLTLGIMFSSLLLFAFMGFLTMLLFLASYLIGLLL